MCDLGDGLKKEKVRKRSNRDCVGSLESYVVEVQKSCNKGLKGLVQFTREYAKTLRYRENELLEQRWS